MKALILAAGLGTRLLPHTQIRPKPLFTPGRETLLELNIRRLADCGCTGIIVNTHHLADQMETFVHGLNLTIPVVCRRESRILDTGGAIKNVRDFMENRPFFVVNSDVVTDLDLGALWRFHVS